MLPMKFRKKWGQFTTEEFTHYLRTNDYKRKDRKCSHLDDGDSDDGGEDSVQECEEKV